jgi:aspartyl/asparaginyl beta-hydroxylase (cupin superfamily)
VLRCHLALYVPDEHTMPCGVIVEDEVRWHAAGELIVFDDSKHHLAFNNHPTRDRYVLIFDVLRPPGLPVGTATGSTTDELEGFISYFK